MKHAAKGFSLLELLIVITLIGFVGLISTQIIILNLRSQGKSEILKEVKQSGDYALTVIETMVRNASDISSLSCNVNAQSVTILNRDGITTTFDCSSGTNIASVSGELPSQPLALTSQKLVVSQCTFRMVCPTPPLTPKYVFVNFTLTQANAAVPVEQRASSDFQTTVSLRGYQ